MAKAISLTTAEIEDRLDSVRKCYLWFVWLNSPLLGMDWILTGAFDAHGHGLFFDILTRFIGAVFVLMAAASLFVVTVIGRIALVATLIFHALYGIWFLLLTRDLLAHYGQFDPRGLTISLYPVGMLTILVNLYLAGLFWHLRARYRAELLRRGTEPSPAD